MVIKPHTLYTSQTLFKKLNIVITTNVRLYHNDAHTDGDGQGDDVNDHDDGNKNQNNSNKKNKNWTNYIINHLRDNNFTTQLKNIIINLEDGKIFAMYVTLFKSDGTNYLSLGPQILITNHADINKIVENLQKGYQNLTERYNITDTDASLIRIRDLDTEDQHKFDQFFFEQMETDPTRKPNVSSGPIMEGLFFPYRNLSESFTHEHAVILDDSPEKIIFIWKKFPEWFIIEYDRIARSGVSYNKNRKIEFTDNMVDGYIYRQALGFTIIFDPTAERVITYSYKYTSVQRKIKPIKIENILANDTSKRAYESYLLNYKGLTPKAINALNLKDHVKSLTPSNLIGTLDCETLGDNKSPNVQELNLISMGAFTVDENGSEHYNDSIIRTPEDKQNAVINAMNFLIKRGVRYLYVHNWSGFDSLLLFKYIQPHWHCEPIVFDGKMIALKIYRKEETKMNGSVGKNGGKKELLITIIDSIKLLPVGLAKLSHSYNVETKKTHFPHYFDPRQFTTDGSMNYVGSLPGYEYFEPKRTTISDYNDLVKEQNGKEWSYIETLRDYQKVDCKALHQIIIKFLNESYTLFGMDATRVLSAPGLAFRMWRAYMNPDLYNSQKAVFDLPKNISDLIREGYYGGHVDVYKPIIEGDQWRSYDVNSLYPSVMIKPLPCGQPVYVNNPDLSNFYGFLRCTVEIPKDTPYPTLPYRKNNLIIFPTGTFTGMWFSEEIRYAISKGARVIKTHWGISFDSSTELFKDQIELLNKIKVLYSQKETFNSSKREIAKLLMNSLYGRFGLRYLDEVCHIYDDCDTARIHLIYKVNKVIPFEDGSELIIHSRLPRLDSINLIDPNASELDSLKSEINIYQNTNVAIAAAITAYARILINDYKYHINNLGGEVAYSDTDSLVCNRDLSDDLVSGTKLGLMKLEREPTKGIFIAPKLYYQEYTKNGAVETYIKNKGYSLSLTRADFERLYNGETITLTQTKMFKVTESQKIELRDVTINYTGFLKKRNKVFNETGSWVATTPIHLTDELPETIKTSVTEVTKPTSFTNLTETIAIVTRTKAQKEREINAINTSRIESLEHEIRTLRETMSTPETPMDDVLRTTINDLLDQNRSLRKQMTQDRIDYTNQINALQSQINTLQDQNKGLRTEISQLNQHILTLTEQNTGLQSQLNTLITMMRDQSLTINRLSDKDLKGTKVGGGRDRGDID